MDVEFLPFPPPGGYNHINPELADGPSTRILQQVIQIREQMNKQHDQQLKISTLVRIAHPVRRARQAAPKAGPAKQPQHAQYRPLSFIDQIVAQQADTNRVGPGSYADRKEDRSRAIKPSLNTSRQAPIFDEMARQEAYKPSPCAYVPMELQAAPAIEINARARQLQNKKHMDPVSPATYNPRYKAVAKPTQRRGDF